MIIYILIMLLFGVAVGSCFFGNIPLAIFCIIAIIILSIIGITLRYIKDKNRTSQTIYSPMEFISKINRIKANKNATAEFSIGEISSGLINLIDAKRYLSEEEYEYIWALYHSYLRKNESMQLNFGEYLNVCNNIISDFDLIAPYYKFCGEDMPIAEMIDYKKVPYRRRAKCLVEKNLVGSSEWETVKDEFIEEFYSKNDMNIFK